MSRLRLLLVEDDPALTDLLQWHFDREDFDVTHTGDGDEALELAAESPPDIVLLDWMIEGVSGLEVCRRLRRAPATAGVPIIMLTGRTEEADRVKGLENGADDYVTKPFSPRELIARVRAVLRRASPTPNEQLRLSDLEMDLIQHKVRRGGRSIALGPTEFRLLRHFLENPARVFSRERLLDAVWGRDREIEPRTVDVHIRRLRQAINLEGRPELIRTVRSAGYALDDDSG
ncbi:phosphate regulon transcriptional regulator PhoB [Sphingosinicella sp.]|uniref:phosphate regulon transcriptional regulator PhoB n=1 Tax=Sphingosinicella sp. TaxID=1917971 RepID=UPI0040384CC1